MKRVNMLVTSKETLVGRLLEKDVKFLDRKIILKKQEQEDAEEALKDLLASPEYSLSAEGLTYFSLIEECEVELKKLRKFKKEFYD